MSGAREEFAKRWAGLAERERRLVAIAAAVVGIALLWSVALGPAIRTLREAPAQRQALQTQLLQMQKLAAESKELRGLPAIAPSQATQALQAATTRLGDKAKLSPQGERSVLTLNGVPSNALRAWLAEARSGARARPVDAQLSRGAEGLSGTITVAIGGTP